MKENNLHYHPFLSTCVKHEKGLVLRIRQATNTGYIECVSGGVFDVAYPTSISRRARVKEDGLISSALMTGESSQCVFQEYEL